MKKLIAIVAVVAVAVVALSSYNKNEIKNNSNSTDKFVAELKNGGHGSVIIGGNKKLD